MIMSPAFIPCCIAISASCMILSCALLTMGIILETRHSTTEQDLVFAVHEEPHADFRREGDDLVHYATISLADALTDSHIHVPCIDGHVLRVPLKEVALPGSERVVPGKGMPILRRSSGASGPPMQSAQSAPQPAARGALRIRFDVKFPSRQLTGDDAEQLRRLLKD